MSGEVVEFADNNTLVEELTSRDSFPGVVVFRGGYFNNERPGKVSKPVIRVEISNGLTNEAAAEMLTEVHKALSHFLGKST